MTLNIKLLTLSIVIFTNTSIAQTTAIPDEGFEEALIDLNIDSDGLVNGQVLTSNIENIVELNFSNLYDTASYDGVIITDFTGIVDFESLEVLNLSNLWIDLTDEQVGLFNLNFNLREFIADDASVDSSPFLCF
jgi:hypothetical protein